MLLSDFDFDLPRELIAQTPASKRDISNLLIIPKTDNCFIQTPFYNLIDYLAPGDVIVFNNSKVIKAKLVLYKNNQKIEIYLNKSLNNNYWQAFAKPARKLIEGDEFRLCAHKITITKKLEMGAIELAFELDNISIFDFLDKFGQMPLPPYIKRMQENIMDDDRYQTIYNCVPGSVAAPTAGLHFTDELLTRIKAKGVQCVFITLHVGAGTFLPVKTANILEHKMHAEYYSISHAEAKAINEAKAKNKRIIAIGTTTARMLESNANGRNVTPWCGYTDIFITPGFKFQIVDMLVSNFHLPKSTLFILLCAFAGYNKMIEAYKYAITNKMRFFSYGDATLTSVANTSLY